MKKSKKLLKELTGRVSKELKRNEGNAMLSSLVISAIILIALILLNTPIRTFITSIWTNFSTFVEGKLTTLFQS
jgi:hypothetical protein